MQRLRHVARQLEVSPPTTTATAAASDSELFQVPSFASSWDDLLEGVSTPEQWSDRREELREKYLRLLRDEHAPSERPALDRVHVLLERLEIVRLHRPGPNTP